jgi:hypothetical protein
MIVRIRRNEEEFNFRIMDVSLSLDVIDNIIIMSCIEVIVLN